MAFLSATMANRILDYLRGAGAPAAIASANLSLHTGDPGAAGTANEVAGGSYVRKAITHNAAAAGSCTIAAPVSFPGMPACTVTHVGLWAADGTFIGSGALTAPKTINAGDTYTHNTDTLSLS